MAKTSCRKSSKASNSKTESRSLKCRLTTPPDQSRHPISRIARSERSQDKDHWLSTHREGSEPEGLGCVHRQVNRAFSSENRTSKGQERRKRCLKGTA